MSLLDALEDSHTKILRPSGGCHNCPRKKIDFVPATLKQTRVIFVGEAPSEKDVAAGEPFAGSSGDILKQYAKDVGITDYSLTNTIHCRPPKSPSPKDIQCCLSQFVLDEIRGYPIVVLCGGTPLRALFPGAKANRYRGNVAWHPDFPGQRFYTTYHPAYILRRKDKESEFRQQMERLGRIVAGEPEPEWKLWEGGGDAYWEQLQKTLTAPLISFDLETNKLESWEPDSEIRSLAVTADGKNVVFANENDPHWIATLEAIRVYLEQPEKHVVGANLGFDLVWMEDELDFRVRCQGRHDVQSLYYEAKQYKMPSLKELVANELDGYRYLIYNPSKLQDMVLLARYNAEDVIYPLQLYRKGLAEVKPKTQDLVMRVEGPSGYILRRMSRNGIYLRQQYRREKIDEYTQRRADAVGAWKEEDPDFIPSEYEAGKGLAKYIFKIKRLPVLKRGESEAPTVDKSTIKAWIRDHDAPYLRHLLELRRIDKLMSTYLLAYDKHVDPRSRIHSQYTNTFTDSGRSSSRQPNLQNIPRDKEIRALFGAPKGSLLVESDLSQIEFRIMISLAGDENGLSAYQRGLDAHTLTAMNFADEPTSEQRTWAKAINFALLYGGDWYNVERSAREDFGIMWDKQTCMEFVRVFEKTYPRLPEHRKNCLANLEANRGWFESVVGHVFHYSDWDHPNQGKRDHAFRAALNAEAQGPAAHLMMLIMIEADRILLDRQLDEVLMVNTVHDSVLTEIPDPDNLLEPSIRAIEDATAIGYEWAKSWLHTPLIMDHKAGESWGTMDDYELPN